MVTEEEVLQDLHSWLFQGTMFEESRSTPSDINAEVRKKEENEARRRQEKRDREEPEKQRFETDVPVHLLRVCCSVCFACCP
jgi:hypothetical protein